MLTPKLNVSTVEYKFYNSLAKIKWSKSLPESMSKSSFNSLYEFAIYSTTFSKAVASAASVNFNPSASYSAYLIIELKSKMNT